MQLKKLGLIFLITISLMFVGCAKTAEISQITANAEIEKNLNDLLQITTNQNVTEAALALPSASSEVKDMVVGVWRASHPGAGGTQCISEWIYQANGAYSGMTQCGPYAVQRSGKWSLPDDTTMRVSLNDGQMIRWDSWKFKMLDRNRMALGDGRLIAYRVN